MDKVREYPWRSVRAVNRMEGGERAGDSRGVPWQEQGKMYFYCKILFDRPLSGKETFSGFEAVLADGRHCRFDFSDVVASRNGRTTQFWCTEPHSDLFQEEELEKNLIRIQAIASVFYCCNGESRAHPVRILEAEAGTSGKEKGKEPQSFPSRYVKQEYRRYEKGWECVYTFREPLLRTFQGSMA